MLLLSSPLEQAGYDMMYVHCHLSLEQAVPRSYHPSAQTVAETHKKHRSHAQHKTMVLTTKYRKPTIYLFLLRVM